MMIRGAWRWGAVLAVASVAGAIGLAVGISGEPPARVIEVPVLAITQVPAITEVPVVTEVAVVTEIPVEVIVEIPAVLPPCPPQQNIDSTLAWLEEARSTHVIWADYLDVNELQDPLAKQGLGTADFHRLWIARYATMIGVAQAVDAIC
jgi:hypothetical protein